MGARRGGGFQPGATAPRVAHGLNLPTPPYRAARTPRNCPESPPEYRYPPLIGPRNTTGDTFRLTPLALQTLQSPL